MGGKLLVVLEYGFDPSTIILVNQEGCEVLAKSLEKMEGVLCLYTAWRKKPETIGTFFNLKETVIFGLAGRGHTQDMSKVVIYVMAKNIDGKHSLFWPHGTSKKEWCSDHKNSAIFYELEQLS